jgi:hypothetical protein
MLRTHRSPPDAAKATCAGWGIAPCAWLAASALLLALAPAAFASTALLDQVAQARDLICELRPTAVPRRRGASLMVYIESVNAQARRAKLVSSGTAGAREVQVYAGDTGVHFVEDVASSVKVTSLLSCEAWKEAKGGRRCVRYEAVSTWHFDTSVHRNVDQAFLKLGTTSYRGTCEPWRLD